MAFFKGKDKEGRGGARPGAGRKSQAERLGLKELLDLAWPDDQRRETLQVLAKESKSGNMAATKMLLEYTFGKPSEKSVVLNLKPEELSNLTDEQLDNLIRRYSR